MITDLGHYIHRELLITNERTDETRLVSHLQYIDWPDHGAPLSTSQFLEYLRHIQKINISMADAEEEETIILVHCSAGIGRTGAFILLDAALHLLDLDFPVNPIQLIKLMRDQRPMMLQTSVILKQLLILRLVLRFFFSGAIPVHLRMYHRQSKAVRVVLRFYQARTHNRQHD